MRMYVIMGHPRRESLCAALAQAYVRGAIAAGHEVEFSAVRELDVDFLSLGDHPGLGVEAKMIEREQALLRWCERWVIVTPNWWWSVPALLKGYFERVLTPGVAVGYEESFPYVRPLLRGREALVIYTQNSPAWQAFATGDRFWRPLRRNYLRHCGFAPCRRVAFSAANRASASDREGWLDQAHRLGGGERAAQAARGG